MLKFYKTTQFFNGELLEKGLNLNDDKCLQQTWKAQDVVVTINLLIQAIIYGGTHCETVPDDDPAWFPCNQWGGVDLVPDPFLNFKRITSMNAWWGWLENTVMNNVRVQVRVLFLSKVG